MTPHPTNHRVTCPECGSSSVVLEECGGFAWLRCCNRECRHVWDEELREAEAQAEKKRERIEEAA
jgi:hypothetical protein